MDFDLISLLCVIIALIVSLWLAIKIRNKNEKLLTMLFVIGFTVYSGIGLVFYDIERRYLFLLQFMLAVIAFPLVIKTFQGNTRVYLERRKNIDQNVYLSSRGILIKAMFFVYIFTYFFPFFYPNFKIAEIFDITEFIKGFASVSSSTKLALKQDGIYQLVCSTLRSLVMPGYFVYLYFLRKKPIKFILCFLLPVYLDAINTGYMFRSEMAIYLAFIFMYMWQEEVLSKHILKTIMVVSIPVLYVFFASLFYIRRGLETGNFSIGYLVEDLVFQEINFVQNYDTATNFTSEVSTIMFFIYVLTCFAPMSVRGIFGIKEINLAHILSNNLLGMLYGDKNYYLLLPSVLGEGIMLFTEYFAFVYIIIVAFIFRKLYMLIARNESMKYLLLYFILDILRQLRGGSQFIISSWIAILIPFYVVIWLLRQSKYNRVSVRY